MRYTLVLFLSVLLAACGGQSEPASESAPSEPAATQALDDAAAEYQEEVKRTVSDSIVKSLAREWGVDEDKARCVLGELRPSQIEQVASDPNIQSVFKDCGVDPSVVK